MYRIFLGGLFVFLLTLPSLAQNQHISGRVTSTDGLPLPGVNVLIKNTVSGQVTNQNGVFEITATPADTLVFSYVGYRSVEVVIGSQTQLTVQLVPDTRLLNEVIVTSLGLEEERNRFASASSNVKGSALVRSGETSVLTALSGKTPGVLITRTSGDPGAGASIQIRGQSSITGNLQPLIVIDGIPVYNATISDEGILAGNGVNNQSGGVVQQSRINDINPDDIASVEILRGASAAALWGSRAANGVIVITTKKGRNTDGKPNIYLRSSYSIDQVNKLPKLQTTFGQGVNGLYFSAGPSSVLSWGDKIADRPGGPDDFIEAGEPGYQGQGFVTFADGTRRFAIAPGSPANPHGGKRSQEVFDHADEIFRTGYTTDHSLSISGGDAKSTYFVSLGKTYTKGIIKSNSNYDRTTLRVNSTRRFGQRLGSGFNLAYSRTSSDRIQHGNNQDGLMLGALRTPADFNNAYFEGTYTDATGQVFPERHISYRNPIGASAIPNALVGPIGNPGFANPFWTIANNLNNTKVDRFTGSLEFTYQVTGWLRLLNRTGLDSYTDKRSGFYPLQSSTFLTGAYRNEAITETQINNDFIVQASKDLNQDFGGTLLAGFNLNHRETEQVGAQVINLLNPFSPPQLQNAFVNSRSPFNANTVIRTGALYGQLDIHALNMLFFSFTGRAETASTFGNAQRTFFYPSAGLAWQFTQLPFLQNNPVFSFGKLRAAFGIVGVQPGPYQTLTYFQAADNTQIGETFESTLDAIAYGGGFIRSGVRGNANLRPEQKTEWEGGLDLQLFNNRVNFSGSLYFNQTRDVILQVPLPASTGFLRTFDNAAKVENRGIELEINADIVKTRHFTWTLSPNWSTNTNKVTNLKGAESVILAEIPGFSSRAVQGQPLGVFWSTRRLRDEQGNLVLNANGFPQLAPTEGVIGNPNPAWRAGLGTTLAFKKLSRYTLFDHVHNLDVANATLASLYFFGTHQDTGVETTVSAEEAATIKTVSGKPLNQVYPGNPNEPLTFRGSLHDFGGGTVALDQSWYQSLGGGFAGPGDQFVENISITRLREITLAYSLTTPGFKKATRFQSVDFAVTGRNLFLLTNYKGIDPETNLTGPSNARGLDVNNNPGTRFIIFSIRINY